MGGREKTKLMLYSTLIEIEVEVGVELGNIVYEISLPPKVIIHQRPSSSNGCLPPKVIYHQRLSSTNGRLPLKAVFHQRLSSTKGCLSLKVIFLQRLSSINRNTDRHIEVHIEVVPT